MTENQISPKNGSVISDLPFQSRSKSSYQVPQNSPCVSSKSKDEEKYMKNNGEKKIVKQKVCHYHTHLKTISHQSEQSKFNRTDQGDILENNHSFSQINKIYEQQLVEKESEDIQEKNSVAVIYNKLVTKVNSSTNTVMKQDVETNTDPERDFQLVNPLKNTPNSSVINMKTSKPEQEDKSDMMPRKTLNIQKMPSVNIRPEFSIQSGPKINIVASNSSLYKPNRKNTEIFDIVYSPSSPVFRKFSAMGNEKQRSRSHVEYICERHVFPSGKLIPGTRRDELSEVQKIDHVSLEEKKVILIDLVKSLSDKLEKQESKDKNNCCSLTCSLPLLASVVNKIQVDCVKCVDVLNGHVDRLIRLMKEELRSQKELSEDHCCQLNETVRYQIVELELMQDDNSRRSQNSGNFRAFKHQGVYK